MTTRLVKPVTRAVEIDGKTWNVTLTPLGVTFREFRRRRGFLLPYGAAMLRAVMLFVDQERREKAAKRKPRVRRSSL